MRLREIPRPEDLESVIYWVKENGQAWPVNDDNVPLDSTGKPFELENGLIRLATSSMGKDPQEEEDFDSDGISTVSEPGSDIPEKLVFKIRMLQGRDDSIINKEMIKTKTSAIGGNRQRRLSRVETEIDTSQVTIMRLELSIVEWEGIADEDGNPAPINRKYIGLLPSWLLTDLTERIEDMAGITEDESGE